MKKLLGLLLVASSLNLTAQDFNKKYLDSVFDVLEKKDQAMGSIAISKNGRTIYSRAIGKSTETTKADPSTLYRIGSITKTFTSVLTMQQVEAGKLELTTTIDKFFPKLKGAKTITIKQLLNHTSGIHNFTEDPKFSEIELKPQTRKDLEKMIASYPADFASGSQMRYSNSNYVLLTFILEDVTGKNYEALLSEKIITPLGLKRTFYGSTLKGAREQAISFTYGGKWNASTVSDMSIPLGAGAIVSTPEDLNTFFYSLFHGKLVSEESLKQMSDLGNVNYGFALFSFPFGDRVALGHNGGIDNFSSMSGYFAKDELALTYISNGTRYKENDIMIAALNAAFNTDVPIPAIEEGITLTEGQLSSCAGTFSNSDIGLKVTVRTANGTLFMFPEGQSEVPMEAKSPDKFAFPAAGVEIIFSADRKEFELKQGGQSLMFKRN